MSIDFDYDTEGWRLSWPDLCDIVERFCTEDETAEELRWLRAHPVDWLMCASYMRERTEAHIAQTRKALSEIQVTDEHGRVRGLYKQAKAETDKRNQRQLHWRQKLIDQMAEAKHILGWEKTPNDQYAYVVERLLRVRMAMISDLYEPDAAQGMVEDLLKIFTQGAFDPAAYRRES